MQVHGEHAKHLLEPGWVLKSRTKDIKICGKIKQELCTYQKNRSKIRKQFSENSGDWQAGNSLSHSRYTREPPTHPLHGDTHGGLDTHTHSVRLVCNTTKPLHGHPRRTTGPNTKLKRTRRHARDIALHLRSPSPSPSPWTDFLMRSSMVVSHWSRRDIESNSFTWFKGRGTGLTPWKYKQTQDYTAPHCLNINFLHLKSFIPACNFLH